MKALANHLAVQLRGSRAAKWLSRTCTPYTVEEPVAGMFRARQIQAVLRLGPLTMLANALNTLLIVATFWNHASHMFLALWGLAVMTIVARGLRSWWRGRGRTPPTTVSQRTLRRATVHASALALIWALVPVVLFPEADSGRRMLIAAIETGMMCAGGFALATTPVAATSYVLIVATGAGYTLFASSHALAWPVGGLLLSYAVIVVSSVWSTARMFGARLMAEAQAAHQSEVIGLLLRDFQENASDILWEIDGEGRLCHASSRLAALFGVSPKRLEATPIIELLAPLLRAEDGAGDPARMLKRKLEAGAPFRDLIIAIDIAGTTRWWSLTAKPLYSIQGERSGWRGVAADVTQAQQANRQLNQLANFDTLTGLTNRYRFREELAAQLRPEVIEVRSCAVVCLDLDHFKTINDTLGHFAGDELLREVSRRLMARTRRSDTVARLGGDEFAIILRDIASIDEAEELTRRIQAGLQAHCEVQGARVAARASIGIAIAPRDGTDIDTLLNHADLALYAAKTAGRSEIRLFDPQMAALRRRRMTIEQELKDALERDELSLAYQPVVDLQQWRVIGFEALLRWRHPELGEVSPGEFIPIAEDSGLIQAIGQWVLAQACRDAAYWPEHLVVSVNVSPVQIMSQELHRITQAALRAAGLAPNRLELEITESIFIHEASASLAVLKSLRESGVRIALDDFGTGYSSLAYLRRFPFDTLKIDRSFVRELNTRKDLRAIVQMIIGMAHTLDMRTVAEGVEEIGQLQALDHYGCDRLQGYYVARPMPADAVGPFLGRWSTVPRPGEASHDEDLPIAAALATDLLPQAAATGLKLDT